MVTSQEEEQLFSLKNSKRSFTSCNFTQVNYKFNFSSCITELGFYCIQIQNHQALSKQRSPITCDLHSTFLQHRAQSLATVNDAQRFFSPQGSEPYPKLICKRQLPCSVYLVSSKCPLGSMNAIICLSAKK